MKKTTNREEWLKERKKGIGASEASCIIGVNPWKTNVELWQEKTGPAVKTGPVEFQRRFILCRLHHRED